MAHKIQIEISLKVQSRARRKKTILSKPSCSLFHKNTFEETQKRNITMARVTNKLLEWVDLWRYVYRLLKCHFAFSLSLPPFLRRFARESNCSVFFVKQKVDCFIEFRFLWEFAIPAMLLTLKIVFETVFRYIFSFCIIHRLYSTNKHINMLLHLSR